MLNTVTINDFKAHQHTRLSLGRFTLLVGDNASGKTSVLDALELQARMSTGPVPVLVRDRRPEDLLRRGASGPIKISSEGVTATKPWVTNIELSLEPALTRLPDDEGEEHQPWRLTLDGALDGSNFSGTATGHNGGGSNGAGWENLGRTIGDARIYELRPDVIAAAAHSWRPVKNVEPDGGNTAIVLANLKLASDETFAQIEEAMRRLVPPLERIRIHQATMNSSDGRNVVGNKIYFDFKGAHAIPAHHASHGTLIVLALLSILYGSRRPNLILLDDFDHALHPRAQMELVRLIKSLLSLDEFNDLQIVATTHSPYTLDEVEANDIHVFALRDDGIVASKRLSEHPDAAKAKGALSAGQLWSLDSERDWVLRDQAA